MARGLRRRRDRFCAMIERGGYRTTCWAPYRPDREMRSSYIETDGRCYWWIYPNMLNRERPEDRKYVPLPA